ncbi:MAG: alpha-2-macroglobulin family protein [Paracoccaceae bacterium]
MRIALMALVMSLFAVLPATAQNSVVPDRRVVVTKDVDFYGADLQALFDTNYQACENLCLSNPQCRAFTFNSRSNACFPKAGVTQRESYVGAWSAIVVDSAPGLLARAASAAAELDFLSDRDFAAALGLANRIGGLHPVNDRAANDLTSAAHSHAISGNTTSAMQLIGAAVSLTDDNWLAYARYALDASEKAKNRNELRARALSAAINAYLRVDHVGAKVSALEVMSQTMEKQGRGRDTVQALRLAETLQPRPEITAALDKAVGKYGFRVTEHKVENDLADPRICAEFSEPLARAGVDYTPYVKVEGQGGDRLSVEASDRQLCLAGGDHGQRYKVVLRRGLPAGNGETLLRDVELAVYIRDRAPAVRFTGRAYVLPRAADTALPVETVNTATLELSLRRVDDRNLLRSMQQGYFGKPLSYWEDRQFTSEVGQVVWTGVAEVGNELNRDMTTRLPMGDALQGLKPGIYALRAAIPDVDPQDEPGATQWFVLSDLGLSVLRGVDGVHVSLRGLGDAQPVAGVQVQLISRANAVLGVAETDASGAATFAPGLALGKGGAEPALIMARMNDDIAFLSLTDPAFDLSDRGVQGHEPAPPVDVFLTTDRGAYRAGEVIHATALARDGQAAAIPGLPLTAILTRPDGVEYARHLSGNDMAGGHVFALPVGATAPRGTYKLEIKADVDAPALAATNLLVEDFLPERIDFTLSLPDAPIRLGDTPPLTLDARYLFGPAAAGLRAEGEVTLSAAKTLDGWDKYTFGMQDERIYARSASVNSAQTDAGGQLVAALELPDITTDRPLDMQVTMRVSEGSGRPVERRLTRSIMPDTPVIGIRKDFDGSVSEGSEAAFRVVALGPDRQPLDMPVTWVLNRIETRYQWYQQYGNWNWEPITRRTRVQSGKATLGAQPLTLTTPVEWGRYELVIAREGGAYVAGSVQFDAGWYAAADAASSPDMLEMSLDRASYKSGDTARLRIVPRYAGVAVVQVMSNRLIATKSVAVEEGETVIDLPVTDDWGAGAYVTAQVIRPMDVAAGHNPARALGLAHAAVDPADRLLQVTLDAPDVAEPRAPLPVAIHVQGGRAGQTTYVTLAAVDLGILNLTGFKSPDPGDHYFGQRRLGVEMRDLYGRLIDGMNGAMGQVRSGGDSGAEMRMESAPPTEDLVVFFNGPVTLDADGRGAVDLDIPDFNGTLRLMAVAWTDTAVGQASRDVILRDPVAVTASLPRFLAPGDRSQLLLEFVHTQGAAGDMPLAVSAAGLAVQGTPDSITLTDGGKAALQLPLTAGETGDYPVNIALTLPNGKTLTKSLTLGVRSLDPETTVTRRFSLGAGDSFILDSNLYADLRPGTGSALMSAGPLARLDAPRLLASLDRYPYGCTEQVTSQAMPLLYLSAVSTALGLGDQPHADARIAQAIERVLTRQASNGAFGLWRADSGDFWLDAYVSDFLSRAQAKGHSVPPHAFDMAMDNLRNRVNYAPDFADGANGGGTDVAYALMVLARQGLASMGDLRYFADEKGREFSTPLAAAQMGAALAMYGDTRRADMMFRQAQVLLNAHAPSRRLWRSDYGTRNRDLAGTLALATEAGSNVFNADALSPLENSQHMSTQESAWALLAANALISDPSTAALELNGEPVSGPFVRRFADTDAPAHIRNASDRPVALTLTTLGVPEYAPEAGGYGYRIERRYYSVQGEEITDLSAIKTGTRLVTVLRVFPAEKIGARLMVNDPLPAGFEIDNPALLQSGKTMGLDWLDTAPTETSEFRADRFLAAVDWRSEKPFTLAYVVRAITPGQYHHPAATVEAMYRPEYRANTAAGRVGVTR